MKAKTAQDDSPSELALLRLGVQRMLNGFLDFRIRTSLPQLLNVIWVDAHMGGLVDEFGEGWEFRDQDTQKMVLQRVSMYVELLDQWVRGIGVFNLLERNIFALRELHDVLDGKLN